MSFKHEDILRDFIHAGRLAGLSLSENEFEIESLPAPHIPPKKLPKGKMGVYVFLWKSKCLKVGKVGPQSQARYTSQHYNPKSSGSNLAKSILNEREALGLSNLDENSVGDWIKENVSRLNILIDKKVEIPALSLLEVFLQCRLKPFFEGFASQR